MEQDDLARWSTFATVAIVIGFGVAFGVAFSYRADSSPVDHAAAGPEVLCVNEGPVETGQVGKRDSPPIAKRIERRALLVGVTKYDNLDQRSQLQGPANDVQLVRRFLQQRYKFARDGIVALTEDEGTLARRPTRSNIEREFRKLAEQVEEGDQVVVLLSGHGARQPESVPPDPVNPEPDGIDEIFLPADVGVWQGFPQRVPNAIVDNEIGTWLRAIAAKRAYICVIFDCCHSATMTRGTEMVRELPPGMLVPREELDKARDRGLQRQMKINAAASVKRPAFLPPQPSAYLVAVYACRPHEVTPECEQPSGAEDAKIYGLLTYSLVEVLSKSANSKAPLTYLELVQRLQVQYAGRPQGSPTPLVEGDGQDRVVLGTEQPMRSPMLLTRDKEGYKVNAGDLKGLNKGSILAVDSPAGVDAEPKLLGHVRVVASRPFDSTVEPCAYSKYPLFREFPQLSSCRTVFTDYGLRRLKVAIHLPDGQEASRQLLLRALEPLADPMTGMVELVKEARGADLVLRTDQGRVELFAASGNRPPFKFPQPNSQLLGKELREGLEKISRASNLVTLASQFEAERSRDASEVDVAVEVLLQKDQLSPVEVMSVPPGGRVFRPGNLVSFRVRNLSRSTIVDVTLLIVGTSLRIYPFYPPPDEVGKSLIPGETFTTPSGVIKDTFPFGPECLVIIAVPAKNPQVDFTTLAQSAIPLGRGNDVAQKPPSPLHELLDSATLATKSRAGLERSTVEEYALRILTWRTEPK